MADAEYTREEHYRAFTESTSDSLYRINADGTKLIEVHGSLLRRHDREADLSIDWPEDYVHPDDREMVHEVWTRAVRTESLYELEHRGKLANGSWGWMISRALPVRNEKGEISEWIGTATDITGNKHREQLLVEQKRLLELIASGAPLDECFSALCSAVPKLNPGVRASVLLADEQRKTFQRSIAPDLLPSFGKGLEGAPIDDHIGTCGEAVYRNKPVTCRDITSNDKWPKEWRDLCIAHGVLACHSTPIRDVDGFSLGSFTLCFDEPREPNEWEQRLTDFGTHVASVALERDRVNRALSESEEKYRTLFESMDEGFCIIEVLFDEDKKPIDFRFLEVNPAFEKQTGIKDAKGKRMHQIISGHEKHWFKIYSKVALTGKPVRFEWSAETLKRFYDIYAFPFGQPDSRKVAILFNDITRRKRNEEQLQTINQTLEERVEERTATLLSYQDQLRSLASELSKAEEQERHRLAADLHDNLGQMLAVGKMKLDLLRTKELPDEAASGVAELAGLMDEAVRYTRQLMSDLKPPPTLDQGDLKAVMAWVAEKMKKHGLEATIEDDGQPKPLSEEVRSTLLQAVRELLFNVVKHAGVNEARIMLSRRNDQVQVIVEDKGKGYNIKEKKPEPTEEGGFGLFHIHERIDLLGGRLEMISEPGEGTKVILIVPVQDNAKSDIPGRLGEEESTLSPRLSGRAEPSQKTGVLLVDDHQMVREGLRKIIEGQDDLAVIAEASDGREAMELARKTSPDVVIMDINMPGMNGIDATREIKSEAPHMHIIGLSLHEEEDMVRAMRDAGASAYVTKAEAFETLCATIRSEAVAVK